MCTLLLCYILCWLLQCILQVYEETGKSSLPPVTNICDSLASVTGFRKSGQRGWCPFLTESPKSAEVKELSHLQTTDVLRNISLSQDSVEGK